MNTAKTTDPIWTSENSDEPGLKIGDDPLVQLNNNMDRICAGDLMLGYDSKWHEVHDGWVGVGCLVRDFTTSKSGSQPPARAVYRRSTANPAHHYPNREEYSPSGRYWREKAQALQAELDCIDRLPSATIERLANEWAKWIVMRCGNSDRPLHDEMVSRFCKDMRNVTKEPASHGRRGAHA